MNGIDFLRAGDGCAQLLCPQTEIDVFIPKRIILGKAVQR